MQNENKRIAYNTVLLYVRMGILVLISLYTSRMILKTLGVEDFGINNVVGGVITFLGFSPTRWQELPPATSRSTWEKAISRS